MNSGNYEDELRAEAAREDAEAAKPDAESETSPEATEARDLIKTAKKLVQAGLKEGRGKTYDKYVFVEFDDVYWDEKPAKLNLKEYLSAPDALAEIEASVTVYEFEGRDRLSGWGMFSDRVEETGEGLKVRLNPTEIARLNGQLMRITETRPSA